MDGSRDSRQTDPLQASTLSRLTPGATFRKFEYASSPGGTLSAKSLTMVWNEGVSHHLLSH
jgi:hypothetical protein